MEYPLHQHGGVEVLVRELIGGLAPEHELFLISGDSPEGIENSLLRRLLAGHFSWPTEFAGREDALRLAGWLGDQRVDLAHFHFGGTYQWRARTYRHCPIPVLNSRGIRCVSTNHGAFSVFECVGPQRPLWFRLAALPLFWPAKVRQVASVAWEATVSKHDLAAVRRRFFPVSRKFTHIYHSKLDGNLPFNERKEPFILCLGTVGRRKGQPVLAEAFVRIGREFPGWKLVIAGRHAEADVSARLYATINASGIADRFGVLTDVSDERATDLLARCGIFAFPSTHEGLGLALQEALFAGAACVGSRAGGIIDLIEHDKTGMLVPPSQPEPLARALALLMSDEGLRKRLGTIGRASIRDKGMTRQGMIARHIELYRSALP